MARPKKIADAVTGHRTKDELEQKRQSEEAVKVANRKKITPPKWLCTEAKKEFNRVVKAFEEIESIDKLVSSLDVTILAMYSDAFFNYTKLVKEIAEEGATQTYTNARGETNTIVSAKVLAMNKYAEMIMKCATKLGLSVSDRLKLVVPKEENKKKNKFDKFIK